MKLDCIHQALLREFYNLKPDGTLVDLAQQIWQTTADEMVMKEQKEIFRQCTYLKHLPSHFNELLHAFEDDRRITLSNPLPDPDQSASYTSRVLKLKNQFIFNYLLIKSDEFAICIHRYERTWASFNERLMEFHRENPNVYTNVLIDLIRQRRQAMIERFNRMRHYKVKTFFDQAPPDVKQQRLQWDQHR